MNIISSRWEKMSLGLKTLTILIVIFVAYLAGIIISAIYVNNREASQQQAIERQKFEEKVAKAELRIKADQEQTAFLEKYKRELLNKRINDLTYGRDNYPSYSPYGKPSQLIDNYLYGHSKYNGSIDMLDDTDNLLHGRSRSHDTDIEIRDRESGDKYRGTIDNGGYTRVRNPDGDILRGHINENGFGRLTDDDGNDYRVKPY